jgi:acetyl/propionyl-CoA carboxylase alpha subunit
VKLSYLYQGAAHSVELQASESAYRAQVGEHVFAITAEDVGSGEKRLLIDGKPQHVHWAKAGRKIWLHLNGRSFEFEKAAGRAAGAAIASQQNTLRAPMPGQVRQVFVETGQSVEAGAVLLLLEAMKMEIRIQSPMAAKVVAVAIKQGQSVEKEQILVELESE